MANEVSVDLLLSPKADKAAFQKIESEAKKSGESSGSSFEKGFSLSFANIAKAGAVAVAAAGASIAVALKKGIDAAIVQEDAVNRLNVALQITGKFSQQASQDIQNFASELQKTTKFGDEAIISTAAYIQQLANLDSQGLKRATKATTDLAAALKIDLESAGSLVAKAIEGNTGALGRYGIKVKASSDATQNLANVLTAVEGKFGGAAQGEINTYSGAITQSSNAFGDLLEEVGFFVTKSPIVISLIKDAGSAFVFAGNEIKKFREEFSFLNQVVQPLSVFADAVINFVVVPLEQIGNAAFGIRSIFQLIASVVPVVLANLAGAFAEFAEALGFDNVIIDKLQTFRDFANETFAEVGEKASDAFEFDTPIADKLQELNQALRTSLEEKNKILAESGNNTKKEATENVIETGKIVDGIYDGLINKTSDSVKKTNEQISEFSKRTGAAIRNGVGVSAANGFAAFGKALAEGENATKAFEKAFIQSIGQVAVQQGTAFILEGAALLFRPGFQGVGAGMIAAGATLAALGGALSAGSSGRPAVGGGGIGATADTQVIASPDTLTQPEEVAQRSESGPRVQVTIQGNVFDTDETGNRIIDIINANFETKGNSFNNARFA